MQNNRLNYALVGAFVLVMAGVLLAAVVVLTGRSGGTDVYFTEFSNVSGLKFGSQVVFEGYPVGQVEAITPTQDGPQLRFRVQLSIAEGWQIPTDSLAEIAAPGLLSAVTVSITGGQSQQILPPESTIPSRPPQSVVMAISSVAGQIDRITRDGLQPLVGKLNSGVDNLNALVAGPGAQILGDFASLSGDLARDLPPLIHNLQEASGHLTALSQQVDGKKLAHIVENVEQVTGGLEQTRRELDGLIDRLDGVIASNSGSLQQGLEDIRYSAQSVARHVDAITQNLEGTSRNMFEFSRQLRQNPGLLLGKTSPPEDPAQPPQGGR